MSILVECGLPASGKTTRALEWVAEDPLHRLRINYDDTRIALYGCKGPTYFTGKDVREKEKAVKNAALVIARDWLEYNPLENSIVIDNTNLTESARAPWIALGRELGIPIELTDIDTPVAECVRRDRLRQGDDRVGAAVIHSMALRTGWIDWEDENTYPRPLAIFDVDGTLADSSRRAHHLLSTPKDWDGFFKDVANDEPRKSIVDLASFFNSDEYHGFDILIVSGRPIDKCGLATEDWLHKHGIPHRHLFMRPSGDKRPDTQVKLEILELLPKHKISYIVDDRDSVCAAWRSAGMTVLQCAPGAF